MSLWAEQQMKKQQNTCGLIYLMDSNDYTNEALIFWTKNLLN